MFTRRRNALQKKQKAFQFYVIRVKGFKEKDAVKNTWEKVGKSLGFGRWTIQNSSSQQQLSSN